MNNNMSEIKYHIRPAARHILTIGRDLIKDSYAALVELVKNAYDADASTVKIIFSTYLDSSSKNNRKNLRIKVVDDGHGMDFETVTTKWLVPSTDDKLIRRSSPGGRRMQGRKGIGRYAAAILGDQMELDTVSNNVRTTMKVNWNDFLKVKYLDEVELEIESAESKSPSGTTVQIVGDQEKLEEWTSDDFEQLVKELRKLLAPAYEENDFDIVLQFEHFPIEQYSKRKIKIEPFPILELYDYRISGTVSRKDLEDIKENYPELQKESRRLARTTKSKTMIVADLTYENQSSKLTPEKLTEIITLDHGLYCGEIKIDLRVFDREPEAIESLIERGLRKPETEKFLGKQEARRLLDEICGVNVYREGFRIRPYGDKEFDWLELDRKRVQNPSLRIGNNQIAGFSTIQPEEKSHLEEKSARDGLKETKYYSGLKEMMNSVLAILEEKRQEFRKKTGRGRKLIKIEEKLQDLFDFKRLENRIKFRLDRIRAPEEEKLRIQHIIEDVSKKKSNIAEDIKRTVARYQGQVTLGKIIMVLMHEGRKPLAYFKNQIPSLSEDLKKLNEEYDKELVEILIDDLRGIREQEEKLVDLFDRLDPLAVRKRGKKRAFNVYDMLEKVSRVFEGELKRNSIRLFISGDRDIKFTGWKSDFYLAFTNLIENSVYWLSKSDSASKRIKIDVQEYKGTIDISYKDNGPGIKEEYIDDQRIFEPDFSTKPDGTGLGLAIAGEALQRNDSNIIAIYSDDGAVFDIKLEKEVHTDG